MVKLVCPLCGKNDNSITENGYYSGYIGEDGEGASGMNMEYEHSHYCCDNCGDFDNLIEEHMWLAQQRDKKIDSILKD
jgi:transposase-like protein